jgi:hypothetical protein
MGTPDQPFYPPYSLTQFPHGVNSRNIPVMGSIVTLTSAQLKALQTTAVTLEPSPNTLSVAGAVSLLLLPKKLTLEYVFKTTAYTIGNANNAFQVEYIGQTTALFNPVATGLVDQAASTVVSVGPIAVGNLALTACKNLGFELKLVGTTPALTLGDGLLVATLEFTLIALQ